MEHRSSEEILIAIRDSSSVENEHRLYVRESVLADLIGITYMVKKFPLVKEASVTDLYTSWCRQINDYLIYNLFGQLALLHKGIKK